MFVLHKTNVCILNAPHGLSIDLTHNKKTPVGLNYILSYLHSRYIFTRKCIACITNE